MDSSEYIDKALKNGKPYQSQLDGNVYCTVRENNPCVDIRQFWKPEEEIVPCKKGLCLRPGEYQSFRYRGSHSPTQLRGSLSVPKRPRQPTWVFEVLGV